MLRTHLGRVAGRFVQVRGIASAVPLRNAPGIEFDEEPAPVPKGQLRPPSKEVEALAEQVLALNMYDMTDMLKVMENRLGLPEGALTTGGGGGGGMMMAAPAAGGGAAAAAPVEEEKTSFDVKLNGFDAAAKLKVIKEIKTLTGLSLKEAKEMVEGAPSTIKAGVSKDEAEELQKKLKEVGADVAVA